MFPQFKCFFFLCLLLESLDPNLVYGNKLLMTCVELGDTQLYGNEQALSATFKFSSITSVCCNKESPPPLGQLDLGDKLLRLR